MSKVRPGNKQNSFLNGEWATHVRSKMKRLTSRLRRAHLKKDTRDQFKEDDDGN
jgi:hypothetical protein